tara:strand:+ start:103 stop:729 length:627 start_codon:yes stop_codon:yes gene_type:complete
MKPKILPAIMAKNQAELNADLKRLTDVVRELHLDVVDGKFANNKTLQFPFRLSKKFKYQAHLMIKQPEKWIKKNLHRIDLFIPHIEEIKDVGDYILWMKKEKKKIAFALLPETKVLSIKKHLDKINIILVLTVHPGFYGSKFLKEKLKKIKQIKKINPKIKIIVDGGMHPATIDTAFKSGADWFVSGSYTTKAENPRERIRMLRGSIK